METKIAIMRPFFEDPDREFQIRELSRIVHINHTTVRQYLNRLVKEDLLKKTEFGAYSFYSVLTSRSYLNLKIYYNLEKLWASGLVDELLSKFELPTIVLFGSYNKGEDIETSDIDFFIDLKPFKFDAGKFEKSLKRKIHIIFKSEANKGVIENINQGDILFGER